MDSKVLACRWEKDEALEAQLRFEVILSNIVARFVSISAEQMESAILDAQRNIGEALGIDRSSVQLGTGSIITSYYSWNRPEVPKLPTTLRRDAYPWQYETIMRGEAIHFSNLCELPPEASADKETHRRNGLKSHACFPLKTGGKGIWVLVVWGITGGTAMVRASAEPPAPCGGCVCQRTGQKKRGAGVAGPFDRDRVSQGAVGTG